LRIPKRAQQPSEPLSSRAAGPCRRATFVWIASLLLSSSALTGSTAFANGDTEPTLALLPGAPDPSARLLESDEASEYWTLYIELESGHRITQRFLLTNVGPGQHTAVAVGHLVEPGRAPYRYVNGRRRARWTLSEDRLFFDIGASHLDLHRPNGQLLITKDDIEIRLFFDFARNDLSSMVPGQRLPRGYAVELLAIAAETRGTIQAPWMKEPMETTGRTWMAHTWIDGDEAQLVDRRVDIYGGSGLSAFYALELQKTGQSRHHWYAGRDVEGHIIESTINASDVWKESTRSAKPQEANSYPLPGGFSLDGRRSGSITLGEEWLRYDPLIVIPNPFRWFVRRMTQPQEVWADARIDVTLLAAPGTPSLPTPPGANERQIESSSTTSGTRSNSDERRSPADSARETEKGSAISSVTGVASITFMNPIERR
jgi:hypothetical protein